MSTAYFYLTREGQALAEKLSASHPGDLYDKENFKDNLQNAFHHYDYLVCIMATGIVVRLLAPLIVHKTSDPGVVILDQKGRYAISLLSGHLGGANDLAREMAALSGGEAVITTATDVAGELSFDTFAQKHRMAIENIGTLKHISGALLDKQSIYVITRNSYPELTTGTAREKIQLLSPEQLTAFVSSHQGAPRPTVVIEEGLTLSASEETVFSPVLYLRPRTICAGIGCKRNMDSVSIQQALFSALKKEELSPLSLKCISTIPLKADEPGILSTAKQLHLPLKIIPTEEIERLNIADLGIQTSDFVAAQTGVLSVSTASAYLASGKGKILTDKAKFKGITIALCQTTEEA